MEELVSAKLELYVWQGSLSARPENPNYVLKKTKLTDEDIITFEISELVKDFVEIKFNGDYNTLVQTAWAEWDITKTYKHSETEVETEVEDQPQQAMVFRGYGNIDDGINPELSKNVMISNRTVHNLCGEFMTIPVYSLDGDGVTEISYVQDSAELESLVTGSTDSYTIAQETRLNPPLTDIITIDKTLDSGSDSDNSVTSPTLPIGTDEMTFTDTDGETTTVYVKCIDECKNTPHKVSFLNKFGVMQDIWFFAKRTDSFSTERQDYKRSILNIGENASYDISAHQGSYLSNQGKEKLVMNTGFIDESYGEVIKELLVSEYVYIAHSYERSPTDPAFPLAVPIAVSSSNFDIKTRLNDKLVEYTLEFEADSDFIQSVR